MILFYGLINLSIGKSIPPNAFILVHGSTGLHQKGSLAGSPKGRKPNEHR